MNDAKEENLLEGQYRDWLKTEPIRLEPMHNSGADKEKLRGDEGREREGDPTTDDR